MWKYEFFSYYLIDYERGDGNYPYNYSDYVLTRLFILFHNSPPSVVCLTLSILVAYNLLIRVLVLVIGNPLVLGHNISRSHLWRE